MLLKTIRIVQFASRNAWLLTPLGWPVLAVKLYLNRKVLHEQLQTLRRLRTEPIDAPAGRITGQSYSLETSFEIKDVNN